MKLRDGYGRSWLCAGYMLDCLSRRVVRARFDGDHNGPLCASASASAPRPAPERAWQELPADQVSALLGNCDFAATRLVQVATRLRLPALCRASYPASPKWC